MKVQNKHDMIMFILGGDFPLPSFLGIIEVMMRRSRGKKKRCSMGPKSAKRLSVCPCVPNAMFEHAACSYYKLFYNKKNIFWDLKK